LRVESVAWISERKDVLSGFFFLLTLYAYVRFTEERILWSARTCPRFESGDMSPHSKAIRFCILALALFALGLMSKPMLVTTPVLLLLLDFWPLQRVSSPQSVVSSLKSGAPRPDPQQLRTTDHGPRTKQFSLQHSAFRIVLEKLPFFALAALFSLITFFVQRGSGAVAPLANISLHDRIDNAIVSYLRYLAKLLWPTRLAIIYPHPAAHYFPVDQWPEWQTPLIALLLLAITALMLLWARRRPYLAFGWFWYLISMLPVIGLIQVGEQAMADRYTYIPLIGPVIALVWLACELTSSRITHHASRLALGTTAVAILALCAFLTRQQVGHWHNTLTLFEHAVAVTGGNPSCQFSTGLGLEQEGFTNQAIVHYRVAMAIEPRDPQSHYNLARLLREQGFLDAAIKEYERARTLNPADVLIELNLARTLSQAGQTGESAGHFEAALRLDPNSIEALNNLAWLLATSPEAQCRDGQRAAQFAQRACELTHFKQPILVGTLAAAYAEAGRFAAAIDAAQKACALADASGDAALAEKNRQLLELYRKDQPFHETTQTNPAPVLLK
jgi:tetratricopeptide (TPR) repeat protein